MYNEHAMKCYLIMFNNIQILIIFTYFVEDLRIWFNDQLQIIINGY